MKKMGLIVNPIAGMGGKVGLKGSDGEETLRQCIEMGAVPEAPQRAMEALRQLMPVREKIEILTYPYEMGAEEALGCGFTPVIIGSVKKGATTPHDTREAARRMCEERVDLLLFAGGDGTARDIFSAVGEEVVALGIPAGVKIHSGVYAVNPRRAGALARDYLEGKITQVREAEVMDIDEEAFRRGRVSAELYGYLKIPFEPNMVQGMKAGGKESERAGLENIAFYILDLMAEEKGTQFLIGPGTTTREIKARLGSSGTLLGVDVALDGRFIANDVNEAQILRMIEGKKTKIIVTIIGGQGYIFGRGNQQFSPQVIKKVGKENIIVVASKNKVAALQARPLLVDTGDDETNEMLAGHIKVVTGYNEQVMCRVWA
jgi:predicted polyphosphate/ATP-dependent NAD kinase